MPWQQQVADVGLEIDPETGLLAYREVCMTLMRQCGKTSLLLPVEVDRCTMWPGINRVIYTAQTGSDARKKLVEDQAPMLMKSPISKSVRQVLRAQGNEQILFRSGSRIGVAASSQGAGHGPTVDMGVIDEAWADEDDRREQALIPAMSTRQNAQLWLVSTQGTDRSVYLNRKVEGGRHAATTDSGAGVAYFEWSIPLDADIDDPATWWECMPALGRTISQEFIRYSRDTMDEAEWRRAYGNQPTKSEHDRVIPAVLWDSVVDGSAEVTRESGPPTYGVDVLPDRSMSAIVASDGERVELIEHRPGTGWITERMKSLTEHWGGSVVIDGGGPAASIADELEAVDVTVKRMTNAEYTAACARMYDSIADQRIRFRAAQGFDDAVAGLARKPVGDRFVWSRSGSLSDITPLVAATLAFGGFAAVLTPGIEVIGI